MFMAIQQNARIPECSLSMHRFHVIIRYFPINFLLHRKIVPFSVVFDFIFFYGRSTGIEQRPQNRPTPIQNCICNLFGETTKWWIYLRDNNVGNKIIGLCVCIKRIDFEWGDKTSVTSHIAARRSHCCADIFRIWWYNGTASLIKNAWETTIPPLYGINFECFACQ